jgi:hypothetical protein
MNKKVTLVAIGVSLKISCRRSIEISGSNEFCMFLIRSGTRLQRHILFILFEVLPSRGLNSPEASAAGVRQRPTKRITKSQQLGSKRQLSPEIWRLWPRYVLTRCARYQNCDVVVVSDRSVAWPLFKFALHCRHLSDTARHKLQIKCSAVLYSLY